MATTEARRTHGVTGMARMANPAFAAGAVAVPVLALVYALTLGDLRALRYVHVMAGVLWTGIDLFMGAVLGPVLGGLDEDQRAAVFERFTPKMTFLMPTLAAVTITGGVELAQRLGYWDLGDPLVQAVLVVVTLLSVNGFGVILPGEVRLYRELVSEDPDTAVVSRIGMRNAKLGGLQGVLQLGIVFLMVSFGTGGPF